MEYVVEKSASKSMKNSSVAAAAAKKKMPWDEL
jgi:hypothetical protein